MVEKKSLSKGLFAEEVECPLCGGIDLEDFFTFRNIPTLAGAVWRDRKKALNAACGDIVLTICRLCGYVFNRAWNESLVNYEPGGYEISLHHSPIYRQFLEETAMGLVERYELRGKRLVEVASGPGYFLSLLCRIGLNEGFGFDPSLESEGTQLADGNNVRLVRGYYDSGWAHLNPDFVCCRHALHSISNPRHFLESIHEIAKGQGDLVIYLEVPNGTHAFQSSMHWTIMYEYRSYFTVESLMHVCRTAGFEVLRCSPCYEDSQYLLIEAKSRRSDHSEAMTNCDKEILDLVRDFDRHFNKRIGWWRDALTEASADGKRILGWGAGGRAITFLCALNVADQIPFVVDVNPNRQNSYLPRTGQEIVSPEFVKEYRPDVILVTNPSYLNEIRTYVASMGIACEFLLI